ncbi:MAG TPA: uL22 family ribosomal protein [Candidatus Pacearchaeota archaeon]|nr:uL22 family ribosomal protein [Candidatus Pacearchaeota archaeon]
MAKEKTTKTETVEEIKTEMKVDEKKIDEKKPVAPTAKEKTKPVVKKTNAVAHSYNAHLSTKTSAAVCRFIRGKSIDVAIKELEDVLAKKRALPMKGEIAHQKGKGMMSGRFPKEASKHFIYLLKSLNVSATANGLENPIISEAVANIGARPYGRFGRFRRKRTHIELVAQDKTNIKSNKKKNETKTDAKNKPELNKKENKN